MFGFDPDESARPIFFGGLIAAALVALFGMLGGHGASIWGVPRGLAASVERALESAGLGGVEVEMRGQTARLAGVVPTEAAIARAGAAALTAAGAGGAWSGGITGVEVRGLQVGAVEQPFEWRAVRRNGDVVLRGAVPSTAARTALLARARAVFPNGEIVDEMHVAGGAPSPAWRRRALDAIDQLAALETGEARFSDNRIVLVGAGARTQVMAVRRHFETAALGPFMARTDVTVTGEPLPYPELADLDLSNADPNVCATAFRRLMAQNVINFDSGSAEIAPESLPVLDSLASVALRCDRYEIEVAGHTDDQGGREFNLDLSRRRAQAVAAYLESLNVARARLHAVGYGADQPVASNATPAGQAANRRIVFTVRG